MMNKFISTLLVVVVIGCGGNEDSNDNAQSDQNKSVEIQKKQEVVEENTTVEEIKGNFAPEYYGKWLRVDNQEEREILSSTNIENYDIESKNLIKINEAGTTYYLMRAGLSDIVAKGVLEQIKTDSNLSKAPAHIGGINVVLENVLDKKIKAEVATNDDGSFKTSSLPAGTYDLSLEGTKISTVILEKPVEDLGVYKLTGDNLHNFKAELILEDEFLYADEKVHNAKIRVHNISNEVGYGLFYTIELQDDDLKSFSSDAVKGSIKPKEYKDIPIHFAFNQLKQNSKNLKVNVTITDVQKHKWVDSFSFVVHKGYFYVNVATQEDRVKGYIIMPQTHEVKSIDINGSGAIKLPLVSNEAYHLLLSNTSFENETAYSLGINKATKEFKNFDYTPAHEPNDKEDLASQVALNENVVSYLHVTDLDYWKISLPESEYLFDFSLGDFEAVNEANLSEVVVSNSIEITSKLTQDKNISAQIDNGSLVVNGVDTNKTTAILQTGDSVAIKLQAPSSLGDVVKSTLLLGQNSLIFRVGTDIFPPKFVSSDKFVLTDTNTTLVGVVHATDQHTVTYTLQKGKDSAFFTLDENSGELRFISLPDYELDFNRTITVQATDIFKNSSTQDIAIEYRRYTRDINNIVTDNYTGYMWQDNIIKEATWDVANNYCQNLMLGGYDDWELPSFDALSSLVDASQYNPAISPIFQNVKSHGYWTRKYYTSSQVYYVSFYQSGVSGATSSSSFYIRCVREAK